MFMVATIGSVYFVFPVLGFGALCGLLLCLWSCQEKPWGWLLRLPRLTPLHATFFIVGASLLTFLNCLLALQMMSRLYG
jgi:hypothetical protein